MRIASAEFAYGKPIPAKFTCKGADAVPRIDIDAVPANAKSLAFVVEDPDTSRGTWVHWTMWDLPTSTRSVTGTVAGAIQGITSRGKPGWHGPCPPSGTHRYFFRLYALDTKIGLPASADRAALTKAMAGHILAEAEYMGTFEAT